MFKNNYKKMLTLFILLFFSLICRKTASVLAADTIYSAGTSPFSKGNRIWFWNMAGDTSLNSEMILIESNGHWGLIDAGNRYADTIRDENGTNYMAPYVHGLSNQISERNGKDAIIYMIETLGVNHLDFIVGTHSHSDHIGGIPEIASILVDDGTMTPHSLIDDTTVYFFKSYHHINADEDDTGDYVGYSWHNQAFHYQAKEAIALQGGQLIDVSLGISARNGDTIFPDQTENLERIEKTGVFRNVSYDERSVTNPYDNRISFTWEEMEVNLYHLYSVAGASNENSNSIVTVITCGDHKVFLGGDIDDQLRIESMLARVIEADHGTMSIYKASHHGNSGSNTKETIDILQPKIIIRAQKASDVRLVQENGTYASLRYYASARFESDFFAVGASEHMLTVDMTSDGVNIYNVKGRGQGAQFVSANDCKEMMIFKDGWSRWSTGNAEIPGGAYYYYFENNNAAVGWKKIQNEWYHFAADGLRNTGWIKESGRTYYLDDKGVMQTGIQTIEGESYLFSPSGDLIEQGTDAMQNLGWLTHRGRWCYLKSSGNYAVGWEKIQGKWYYFDQNFHMQTGWIKSGNDWYYLNKNGDMVTGWIKDKKKWYYLKPSGAMAIGWVKDKGKWYYMQNSGAMCTGWIKVNGKWYCLRPSGMMITGWHKEDLSWYYLNSSGEMTTGWLKKGNNWYYFDFNGMMLENTSRNIKGKIYRFDNTGVCINP